MMVIEPFLLSITISIDPILVQLGPLAVRWYGLMYVIGIAAGLYVAIPYARQRGLDEGKIWSVVWWGVIAGLVGARLYYVVQSDLGAYLAEPWRVLAVWEGGMAFYGAIAGVAVTVWIVCRRVRMPFWTLMDAASLLAVVGQAFGRIGNIVNGDVVGYPTDLPWGFVYEHPRSFVTDHTVAYHPAAVYELLFNIGLFAILWTLRFRLRRPGSLFATYLIIYSLGQFVIFFLRDNEVLFWGLKNAQLTALVVLLAAVPLWWWRRTRGESEMATGESSPNAPLP
ncbi:MAG: prolipoprotein diacylglyceryl transferase [Chloroflexi bacterium]|nr:prolipoprotein diacylglyceryl transferase [Chloroflexota bacterium]